MRAILVAAMAAMVAMAGPVFAGGITDDEELRLHRDQRSKVEVEPAAPAVTRSHDVVVEEYHSAGAEFGLGIASTVLSLIYHPPRLLFGFIGAGLGGFGGWATGGDLRTAKALWRPTVEGDYFIRTDHLDGAESFDPVNATPVFHGRYTVHERVESRRFDSADDVVADRDDDPDDLESEEFGDHDTHEHAVNERARELNAPSRPWDDEGR